MQNQKPETQTWRRNLYGLWAAQFIAMMGMSLILPFIPLFIKELGVTEFRAVARWSGLVFAATFLCATIFGPIWGTIGDRYGRKLMVLRAMFGVSIAITLMGFAHNVYQLFILRLLQGTLGGFVSASMALVSTSAPRDRTGYALGFLQTSMIAGGIIGPLFGGALADLIGFRHIFWVTGGLSFIGATIVALTVKEERLWSAQESDSGVIDNFRFFLGSKQLIAIALSLFIVQVGIMMVEPILALYIASLGVAKKYLATTVGAIFASTGLVTIFAAPRWGKRADRLGYKNTLAFCLLGAGLCFFPQAIVSRAYQLGLLRMLLGSFSSGIAPSTQALIAHSVPESRRGGIYGATNSAILIGNAIGPTAGGLVAAAVGMRYSFVITGFFLLIARISILKLIEEPKKENYE